MTNSLTNPVIQFNHQGSVMMWINQDWECVKKKDQNSIIWDQYSELSINTASYQYSELSCCLLSDQCVSTILHAPRALTWPNHHSSLRVFAYFWRWRRRRGRFDAMNRQIQMQGCFHNPHPNYNVDRSKARVHSTLMETELSLFGDGSLFDDEPKLRLCLMKETTDAPSICLITPLGSSL